MGPSTSRDNRGGGLDLETQPRSQRRPVLRLRVAWEIIFEGSCLFVRPFVFVGRPGEWLFLLAMGGGGRRGSVGWCGGGDCRVFCSFCCSLALGF